MATQAEHKEIYSLLGIAAKGRRVVSGGFMTERAVQSGAARLVLISGEASQGTRKKFTDLCGFYRTPLYVFGSKEALGHAIGKEERAVLALTDEGLAAALDRRLSETEDAQRVRTRQKEGGSTWQK